MKKTINKFLGYFDIKLTKKSSFERVIANSTSVQDIELLKAIPPNYRSKCVDLFEFSKSQLRQDLFVLCELGFKTNGFFVEFGAANGVDLSNSFLLEKKFQWQGILAEPAKMWHKELRKNRASNIETKCVWKNSDETLTFNETAFGELSTIDSFSREDKHSEIRRSGTKYDVDTISLLDLLVKYDAPKSIDYLSIDTEGSEYDILRDFDFNQYQFNVITCEHNKSPMRQKIYELLTDKGYVRKFEHISKFDDWYVFSGSPQKTTG